MPVISYAEWKLALAGSINCGHPRSQTERPGPGWESGHRAAQVERRLAAIVVADIVGYSRLVERDEKGTLAAVKTLRCEIIHPLLSEHRGRIVKLLGDGAIAEFGSVVDAATFAITMQKEVAADQAQTPPDRRIVFRIGINLGDVVVEDGDLLGDGVNVAARLEQLCAPGGILISGTAYDHLHGKVDLPLEFTGEQRVKNISRLVRTYRIGLDDRYAGSRLKSPSLRQWNLPTAVALAFLAGGVLLRWPPREPQAEPTIVEQIILSMANKPSIDMLPFDSFGSDPEQAYFAVGIAQDLITNLSKPSGVIVIAANSIWTDKGKSSEIQKVAANPGVRYVMPAPRSPAWCGSAGRLSGRGSAPPVSGMRLDGTSH